jgi:hypothetical protein
MSNIPSNTTISSFATGEHAMSPAMQAYLAAETARDAYSESIPPSHEGPTDEQSTEWDRLEYICGTLYSELTLEEQASTPRVWYPVDFTGCAGCEVCDKFEAWLRANSITAVSAVPNL